MASQLVAWAANMPSVSHLRVIDDAVNLSDLARNPEQKTHLDHPPDLALIVLEYMCARIVPLRLSHFYVPVDKHPVPWDLDIININDGVVLV